MRRSRGRRSAGLWLAIAVLCACRGEPVGAQKPQAIQRLVDSLKPAVERAAGLSFKAPVRAALRDKAAVRSYLLAKLDEQMPASRRKHVATAYRLFGLLPDTLDLDRLLVDLYAEQVAGYYEPDSTTLYGVTGADPAQLRLVVAHEMVHALQHQYTPVDSIMRQTDDGDRLAAAQSVLEGQATLVSIDAITPPGQSVTADPIFWESFREQLSGEQGSMRLLARAPLVLREGLIFPYLGGAEFMQWWRNSHPARTMPFGNAMPTSTEQILFPERYARGDRPVQLRFQAGEAGAAYDDVMGELGLRILESVLAGENRITSVVSRGWGGDRFRVYETEYGPALVWYVVWDDSRARGRFLQQVAPRLHARSRPGYRSEVASVELEGRPATRWIFAPALWDRWRNPPAVTSGAR